MPDKKENPKNKIKKSLEKLTDTVDLDMVNNSLRDLDITTLTVSKKTLMNIATWFLDGKSEFEVRQNLELSIREWQYLCNICPAVVFIMQHATAYADMVVGATLLQTAIGGKITKKKVPMKVKDYNEDGKPIAEHFEMVEIEEVAPPNPYLLKYLAENKLSEKFGDKKKDTSKEHREIIEGMTQEEIEALNNYGKHTD